MTVIDTTRLRNAFEDYSAIGRTDNEGLHRLTLTDTDREVRDTFVKDLRDLGLDIRIDEVGNIFGRRAGSDPDAAPVLIGSHLDSQPYGGRYDGQLGVLAALETLRTFDDEGIEPRRPIEIVNWTNEEGSRFKPALMGSGAFVGELDVDDVLTQTDADGVTVEDALEAIGYKGDTPVTPTDELHSYLELHVEQGPKLEQQGLNVGIVDGVFGMAWLEATVYGETNHAGPTPVYSRNDALVAATDVIESVRRLSNHLSNDAVTTVGELSVEPDSINVIPDEVTFTIDIRSYEDTVVETGVERVREELEAACAREGTTFELKDLWRLPHTEFSPTVCDSVAAAATESDWSYQRMIGGAGHDANYLNEITDTGLLFVPSVGGKTHNEAEFTEWEDVIAGVDVFARSTRQLASQ